jgi:hypothetical protein
VSPPITLGLGRGAVIVITVVPGAWALTVKDGKLSASARTIVKIHLDIFIFFLSEMKFTISNISLSIFRNITSAL